MKCFSLCLAVFLLSCNGISNNITDKPLSTRAQIINEKIVPYILKNANDPKSYEPISTTLKDSITYMKQLSNDINSYNTIDISSNDVFAREARERWAALRKQKDSLQKGQFKDFTKSYTFIHECRIKNSFGGLIKTSFNIVTDTDLNIISVTEN